MSIYVHGVPIDMDREWELVWESENPTPMWNPCKFCIVVNKLDYM